MYIFKVVMKTAAAIAQIYRRRHRKHHWIKSQRQTKKNQKPANLKYQIKQALKHQ